jgi:glycine/D-amino acid oxidase-like deaminating enzyme
VNTTADVVVVGTGLLGLATAFELLDRGLSVALVGPRTGGHHGQASRAAGAMLTVFSEVEASHPAQRVEVEVGERLAARSGYEEWLQRIAVASGRGLRLVAGVWVIGNGLGRDDAAELAAIASAAHRHGHQAELVAASQAPVRPQARAHQALWLPSEGSLDPVELMSALTIALERSQGCRWLDAQAAGVREHGQGIAVDDETGQSVEAAHLVLAAGVRIPAVLCGGPLAEAVGLPPLWSGRGVSVVVSAGFDLPAAVRTPNRGFACGAHLVPRGPGTVYLGATNRLSTEPDLHRRPSLDELATLIHDGAVELNTGLRDAQLLGVRVGHRPVTADHLPLIGRTRHDRVHVATGTYRCGVLLAPRAAALVAQEILAPGSGSDHPYSPRREVPAPRLPELLAEHAPGLAAQIGQPGGHLPPGAQAELEKVLHAALREMLTGSSPQSAALRRLWERAPIAECLPLLLTAAGRLG